MPVVDHEFWDGLRKCGESLVGNVERIDGIVLRIGRDFVSQYRVADIP